MSDLPVASPFLIMAGSARTAVAQQTYSEGCRWRVAESQLGIKNRRLDILKVLLSGFLVCLCRGRIYKIIFKKTYEIQNFLNKQTKV